MFIKRDGLGQVVRNILAGECINFYLHQSLVCAYAGRSVGINDVLIDTPSDLNRNVIITGEQVIDLMLLMWGQ